MTRINKSKDGIIGPTPRAELSATSEPVAIVKPKAKAKKKKND
jgi:hypothetical protein